MYVAERQRQGKKAGPIRNQQIVNDADALVAFWDSQSKGTKNSIDLAGKKGILVTIIPPHEIKENAVLPIDVLCLQPRNYRQHPHKQIEQFAASLQRFDQICSIIVGKGTPVKQAHTGSRER